MQAHLDFHDPLIVGTRVRYTSTGPDWSTDAEGVYGGVVTSEWDGQPMYAFADGIIGSTPQTVFQTPVHTGVRGIWTPSAAVLCYACHGAQGPVSVLDVCEHRQTVSAGEGEGVTLCDRCSQPVVINAPVAAEHNLASMLRAAGFDASMDQTGGMCSAVEVTLSADRSMLLVQREDGDTTLFQAFVIDSETGEGQDEPADGNWDGVEPWDVPALITRYQQARA